MSDLLNDIKSAKSVKKVTGNVKGDQYKAAKFARIFAYNKEIFFIVDNGNKWIFSPYAGAILPANLANAYDLENGTYAVSLSKGLEFINDNIPKFNDLLNTINSRELEKLEYTKTIDNDEGTIITIFNNGDTEIGINSKFTEGSIQAGAVDYFLSGNIVIAKDLNGEIVFIAAMMKL